MESRGETEDQKKSLSGMKAFGVIWAGQLVSLLGTGMTQFAVTIWAWQETGSATALSLVAVFNFAPTVLLSPVAGALVDRWNRKLTMMLSDLLAGTGTLGLLFILSAGELEIWHLYVAGLLAGAGQAFQWPAYSAAISTMMSKEQYGRANGMLSSAEAGSTIATPVLGAALLALVGIGGVFLIDVVTFSLAIVALLVVHVPQPAKVVDQEAKDLSLWSDSIFGFRYILARRSLLGLQLVFTAINFVAPLSFVLLAPMVLARTGNNELVLGSVQSVLGVGGLFGGIAMSVWGGPKRRVHGVLLGMVASSLLGSTLIGLARDVTWWSVGAFFAMFFIPIVNGSNQAIWQTKVAPALQGRVFAARRLIAQVTAPLAMFIAGPLADYVFEPLLATPGRLSWLVGSGPGTGMALMFILAGVLGVLTGVAGYLIPEVRLVEDILPDHDAAAQPMAGTDQLADGLPLGTVAER
ncbi:MAG: MFS transporter [Anaerolineales bacterium]|nr:MFS transporter [Anaerolineales bacterium]